MEHRFRVIGETFVRKYFEKLFKSPELVHRYYKDWSVLTRPDRYGALRSVTTIHAINDLILSLDFKSCDAQIKSTDVQRSRGGLVLLVTGYLIRKEDQLQKKFVQSFYLAPQHTGYYVFNDIFRYVDEDESLPLQSFLVTVTGTVESSVADNITSQPEPSLVSQHTVVNPATSVDRKRHDRDLEVDNHVENEEESVVSAEIVAESDAHSSQKDYHSITEIATSDTKEDGPKKSYAASVNVMSGGSSPRAVYVPVKKAIVAFRNNEQQKVGSVAAAPGPEVTSHISKNPSTASDSHDEGLCFRNIVEVQHHFIFIPRLPLHASVTEVEEELRKFGSVKPGGVIIKTNTFLRYCYCFVEFEALSSVMSALEASTVTIAGCRAVIEPYRYQSRAVRERAHFTPNWSRAGNENMHGDGNFGGGRVFGHSRFISQGGEGRGRGGYRGRGQGSTAYSGEGHQGARQW